MSRELLALLIVAALALPWPLWWVLRRARRQRRLRRARLAAAARRETDPQKRREMLLRWNDMGGGDAAKRAMRRNAIREQGQQARTRGEPLTANPYPITFWGRGRQWKAGWKSVEKQVRWLESHREEVP